MKQGFVHPYMPGSVPEAKARMLEEIGAQSIEEIYKSVIPDELLFKGKMALPEPFLSEVELKRHMMGLLSRNSSCTSNINFLGAGCYQRHIPAVCDEIVGRAEFLTAYCGDTYSDHGKMQAIFEYTSMMAELLDMDVVSYTNYDGGQAVSSAMRMALRMKSGRMRILVPSTMNPEIFSQAQAYCKGFGELVKVQSSSGLMDMDDLQGKLDDNVAAVFLENPTFLGSIEANAREICSLVREKAAIAIVMPEVSSLGIMEAPVNYGADIVCGDIQPLGINMQYGSGCAGFIATRYEQEYIEQFPTYFYGIVESKNKKGYGWGRAINYRCSHHSRENANEYFGTEAGLWAIAAAVYLALMGPQGMNELGELIIRRCRYAINELSALPGLKVNPFGSKCFQEFIIDFSDTGLTVEQVNGKLLGYGIFGGLDLSKAFPEYGQSALYCVSDVTGVQEIKALCNALKDILAGDV